MPDQQPSVGQIVHYRSHGTPPRPDGSQAYRAACHAAMVTELCSDGDPEHDQCVGLSVFNPDGLFLQQHVAHSPDPAGGTWHWPERV